MVNGNPRENGSGPSVEIRDLTRSFGNTLAVSDLSFDIFPGEVVGFIGPNGAGKTTTMRILATLDEPNTGDAFVEGFSVINDPDLVRRRLGYMPDSYGSYQNVSCIEYLDFFARTYGLRSGVRIDAIKRVIDFTHMAHMVDKPVSGLSKGMKQRLCLGRALIHDPSVLILDEPAAGLDPRARIELKEMIGRLAAQGKSVLISSHILSELAEMCHRVVIIERGKLLGRGSVDEIMHSALASTDNAGAAMAELDIELVGDSRLLIQWLLDQRQISAERVNSSAVRFVFLADAEAQADLLHDLISNGFRISRFQPKKRSLEEVFLHVTRGEVQ